MPRLIRALPLIRAWSDTYRTRIYACLLPWFDSYTLGFHIPPSLCAHLHPKPTLALHVTPLLLSPSPYQPLTPILHVQFFSGCAPNQPAVQLPPAVTVKEFTASRRASLTIQR
jgi:hypothetical protein